jgi:hypothetical protein
MVVGFGIGVACCVPIGGGVGGGVAACAALRAEGYPKAKIAAAVRQPAPARNKEDSFMGSEAFLERPEALLF